jgi:hypothetical protein
MVRTQHGLRIKARSWSVALKVEGDAHETIHGELRHGITAIASYNNDVTMVETGSHFSLTAPLSSVSIQPAFASPFHVALSAG